MLRAFDQLFIHTLNRYGIFVLRVSLAAVFIWFGYLKVIDQSPVKELVESTFDFITYPSFFRFLGWGEILIGACLLFKFYLRAALGLLWLQMLGTFAALFLNPELFFQDGSFLLLTTEGEFVVKNIVLVASSLVIGGNEVK
jgi:uncharacterized membrane protein YkgB